MLILLISLITMGAETSPSQNIRKTVEIECTGTGPSITIARSEALDECRKSAIQIVNNNFEFTTLTVQTETDAAIHEEIRSKNVVSGLSCDIIKETKQEGDGTTNINIKCRYDLSKVKIDSQQSPKDDVTTISSSIASRANNAELGKTYSKTKRAISVSTIPQCASILIHGVAERIIRCSGNPVQIVLTPEETALIIRADGYKPKTLSISDIGQKNEIQVILNP